MAPYSGPVVDPFRLQGPDGNTYFDLLTPPRGLVKLYVLIEQFIVVCQKDAAAAQYPAAKTYWSSWAKAFQRAFVQLERAMDTASVEAAQVADAEAVGNLKNSQVRPDTSKQRHLEDNIVSRPLRVGAVALGGAGLYDISVLDKTRQQRGGTYWEAQEFGTDAHVGRVVRGFFQPGRARPSQADFRTHPEFQATKGPQMTIARPIEERGFLRRGVEAAGTRRALRVRAAQAEVIKTIRAFKASSIPPPPAAPRVRRRK